MKGHMQDGKFHPHTDYKKGTRKSRDQTAKTKGVRLARGDNNTEILKNRIRVFNNFHRPEVDYENFGGGSKFLALKGTQTALSPAVSKSEAIDYLEAIDKYVDHIKDVVDGTNGKILTLQPTGKKAEITSAGDVVRKARDSLSDRDVERLGELGNTIQTSLSCDVTGAGFPCRTDRFEAVRAMEEYLAIHNLRVVSV